MNFLIVLMVSFFSLQTSSYVNEVRNLFPEITSEEQADILIKNLKNDVSPEAKGYIAVMYFMKSRLVTFPFTKLKYFKIGKQHLDEVITNNPTNVELRYLRYVMQKQIPEFLGYHKNINEDFTIIVNQLINSDLQNSFKFQIINNMLLVTNLSELEKEELTTLETSIQ